MVLKRIRNAHGKQDVRECVNRKGKGGMSASIEWGGIAQASS